MEVPKTQPVGSDPLALKPIRNVYAIPAVIVSIILIAIIFHVLSDAFLPFVTALLIANIFTPLVEFLKKKKVPMGISIVLVLVIVAGVLTLIGLFVNVTVATFIEIAPKYQAKWDQQYLPKIIEIAGSVSKDAQQKVMHFNPMSIINPSQFSNALFSLTSLISGFALILLFMLFILASNGQFRIKIAKAFPSDGSNKLAHIVENIDTRVRKYLLTTLMVNTLAGVVMVIELSLFGVDLALLLGVLTFLLMFIPSIGSIFAIVIAIAAAFVQFDSLITPIILSIIVIVSQLMIGSVLSPRIMGKSLNLSPLLLLVSIIFWGWVWGPMGMILSVPITSSIAIIFENIPALQPLAILMSSEPSKVKGIRKKKV